MSPFHSFSLYAYCLIITITGLTGTFLDAFLSLNLPKEGYSIASNISVDAGLSSPLPLLGSQVQLLKAVCVLEYLKTCSLSLGGTTCTIQIIQFGVDYTIWGGDGTTIRPSFSLT